MKKTMKLAALVLSLIVAVTAFVGCGKGNSLEAVQKKGVLTVATSPDFPPFESLDGDRIVGIEVDILEKIAETLGEAGDDGVRGMSRALRSPISACPPAPLRITSASVPRHMNAPAKGSKTARAFPSASSKAPCPPARSALSSRATGRSARRQTPSSPTCSERRDGVNDI